MPYVPNTPESLLDRSDSLNPGSTCRGITSNGRYCRRPITAATPDPPSFLHTPKKKKRASTPDVDLTDETLYCWQHKDQAATHSAQSSPGPRTHNVPQSKQDQGRTSIDTLADRLGLIELEQKEGKKKQGTNTGNPHPPRRPTQQKPRATLQFCCCFTIPIEELSADANKPARPQPRPVQKPTSSVPPRPYNYNPSTPQKQSRTSRKSTSSQTAQMKDLIPDDLDAVTASALMAELSKPYVESEEPGYIYMFWLTPSDKNTNSPPPVDAARSLLAPPSSTHSNSRSRRPSDVVSSFTGSSQKTMLLKIGRAANVHRRMNQWQRQCGKDIEVLRYYPYKGLNSSPAGSPSRSGGLTPRTTPHVKKVERLIHLELAGRSMAAERGDCEACGREHREWFKVEGTRKGVGLVDRVIRRWVEWDERLTG